ncbi:MAG TPA: rRNA maturation RNase YbeY [Draconibacterium sp.]|nr:rRNA maturation RNase YbeY [Draconibacterium sp.]
MSKTEIFYEDIQPLKLQKRNISEYIKVLIDNELKESGEISIIFCSDKYLLEINTEYLQHNFFTDIITFNYVEGNIISGDLFISSERVKENAAQYGASFIMELYRVIFHGVLHLVGYNDKTENEKKIMREKEDYYLSEVDFREIEI